MIKKNNLAIGRAKNGRRINRIVLKKVKLLSTVH